MSVNAAEYRKAFDQISKVLFSKPKCDHEGMKFWADTNEDGTCIMFQCPKCKWAGAMHPDRLAEYERMARDQEECGINQAARSGTLKVIKQ